MQTHEDRDFNMQDFMERLKERAATTVTRGESQITAGKPGEPTIEEWVSQNGVNVRQLPDDEQGILRISVGGGIAQLDGNYCVFRGDLAKCVFLLRLALSALDNMANK